MTSFVLPGLVLAATPFAGWVAYLAVGCFVFARCGRDPAALDHVAELGRGFPLMRRKGPPG